MTEPTQKPHSEDCRRPKAIAPYVTLWVITVGCVIFALIAMLNQG